VSKGKKMPGHMGAVTVTQQVSYIYKIDTLRNLIYVRGALPGKAGTLLRLIDSPRRPFKGAAPPPFPTYTPTEAEQTLHARWQNGEFMAADEELRLLQQGVQPAALYENASAAGGRKPVLPPYELIMAPPTVDPFAIPEHDEPEPTGN
jgi:large subunit ribosomal protein L3